MNVTLEYCYYCMQERQRSMPSIPPVLYCSGSWWSWDRASEMEGSERLRRAILPWSMVTGGGRGGEERSDHRRHTEQNLHQRCPAHRMHSRVYHNVLILHVAATLSSTTTNTLGEHGPLLTFVNLSEEGVPHHSAHVLLLGQVSRAGQPAEDAA